jgi:hypothetical protein
MVIVTIDSPHRPFTGVLFLAGRELEVLQR